MSFKKKLPEVASLVADPPVFLKITPSNIDVYMPMSNLRNTPVEELAGVQRRRRSTSQQKLETI